MKLSLVAIALAGVLGSVPVYATCNQPTNLKFFGDDTGLANWHGTGGFDAPRDDSPLDPNFVRLGVHVLDSAGNNDFVGAYNDCVGIKGKPVGQVKNLSFDFQNTTGNPAVHIGAGAPRYSVDIDQGGDGDYDFSAFLAAFYCQGTTTNAGWSRADFTGQTALGACSIWVNNVQYFSDGTRSAWKVYADANPTDKVMSWVGPAYLVMDEVGTAFVDRLAFQNKMFIRNGTSTSAIKNCGTEAAC